MSMASTVVLDSGALQRALVRMAHQIAERNPNGEGVVLAGVQTGGVHLARRLAILLKEIWMIEVPCGTLDATMHRDDLDTRGTLQVHATRIPGDIQGKTVVLVDDVLFSGRTTRAALDALNDYGRPRRVQLAVLVDRGHRDLPIQPDFVGAAVATTLAQRIDVKLLENDRHDEVRLEELPA